MKLHRGDFFLTNGNPFMGWMIKGMEGLYNTDKNQVLYSHAGLIIDDIGTTFESYWTVTSHNIFERFTGHETLIARYRYMDDIKFNRGFDIVSKHKGELYPIHRLFFYVLGVAEMIHWRKCVCSELVARFFHEVCKWDQIFDFERYFGMTPDNLMDVMRVSQHFEIIHEGILN